LEEGCQVFLRGEFDGEYPLASLLICATLAV